METSDSKHGNGNDKRFGQHMAEQHNDLDASFWVRVNRETCEGEL